MIGMMRMQPRILLTHLLVLFVWASFGTFDAVWAAAEDPFSVPPDMFWILLCNEARNAGIYVNLIKNRIPISPVRDRVAARSLTYADFAARG